jgi:hypothetical protein
VTEQEIKIAQLESEVNALKSTLKQAVETIKAVVKSDSQETEQRITTRMTSFLGDRLDDALKLAKRNEENIAGLQQAISGDGDQDPGLKSELKTIEKDVSDLKLESRDRTTRNNFVRSAWAVAGTVVLGLGIGLFRSVIDEKAASAAKTQADNVRRFDKIEEKVETNNNQFFKSIGELNAHKATVEESLDWIKAQIKK